MKRGELILRKKQNNVKFPRKELSKELQRGILTMLSSSLLTCCGQLCWKLSTIHCRSLLLLIGFAMYGIGAILMIYALRFGELSILHPLLSAGYILSLVLGAVILHEPVSIQKVIGVTIIILGLILISAPEETKI